MPGSLGYCLPVTVRAVNLRTERATGPIGIGVREPRFSWRLETDDERDVVQLAARAEVEGVWDGGWREGHRQQIVYTGPALVSRSAQTWRVFVRTSFGEIVSRDATFE